MLSKASLPPSTSTDSHAAGTRTSGSVVAVRPQSLTSCWDGFGCKENQ